MEDQESLKTGALICQFSDSETKIFELIVLIYFQVKYKQADSIQGNPVLGNHPKFRPFNFRPGWPKGFKQRRNYV